VESISRKAEILNVAAKLIRERGYQAVSMRDLAAELRIKAASIYNHFSGKQAILEAIVLPTAQQFTDGMQAVRNSGKQPAAQLREVILLHISLTLANPDAMACLNNDWIHLEANAYREVSTQRETYELNFRHIIREGVQSNAFENLDEEIVLYSFLSTLRTLYQWYKRRKSLDQLEMRETIVKVLLQGIVRH
jgi:TetR/AcrR family transcriptional regulator, cholesterol catabolism regulator